MNCGGVLYTALVDEFNASRGATAWVSSLPAAMVYFSSPLSTSLSEQFGCRAVTIAGAVTCIIAMVLSSFYTSLYYLYVTHGVLWGLGMSLSYFPTFMIISKYFETRLSLANGIITCGASIGTLTLSPGLQWLFNRFGLSSAFRILGAVHLVVVVCGVIFRPVKDATAPEKRKYFDWSICKNRSFIVYITALSFVMLGYLVPYVHLVRMAEESGATQTEAALLISYLAAGSGSGRLFFGRIADFEQCNRFFVWQTGLLGISVSSTLVSLTSSYKWLVVYAFMFGLFEGCYVTLNPVLIRDIVGSSKFPHGLGMAFFTMSFTRCAGPPIAGWIYDSFHRYYAAFLYTGLVILIGNCIVFLVPVLMDKSQRMEKRDRQNASNYKSQSMVVRETDV